jgi:hypothetical protein
VYSYELTLLDDVGMTQTCQSNRLVSQQSEGRARPSINPYVPRLLRVLGCPVPRHHPQGVNFGRSIESVSLLSLPVNLNGTW